MVWDVAQSEVPRLKPEVAKILRQAWVKCTMLVLKGMRGTRAQASPEGAWKRSFT